MARYPTIAAESDPARKSRVSCVSMPLLVAFARLNAAAAVVMGTLIRNEKRAASSRLRPGNNPNVMVAPERKTPGTKAEACAITTATAHAGPILEAFRLLRP